MHFDWHKIVIDMDVVWYALLQWLGEYSGFICLAVNIANTPTDAYSTHMQQTFYTRDFQRAKVYGS